jgi:hypothetical protein
MLTAFWSGTLKGSNRLGDLAGGGGGEILKWTCEECIVRGRTGFHWHRIGYRH